MNRKLTLTFCSVVMNRFHHIRETLAQNIKDHLHNDQVNFLVLDYNSKDGVEEWMAGEMKEHILSGKLLYFRTSEPTRFHRSHSRNMMFRLAPGDLVCNIDADNFTGKGFGEYVLNEFEKNPNIIIVPDTKGQYYSLQDAYGRFCSYKEDFEKVTGYDEAMAGYGYEDLDLYGRILMLGREPVVIQNTDFLKTIPHGDEERISNESFKKDLKSFYIRYIDAWNSEVLFMYKNKSFEKGTLIPNRYESKAPASIKEGKWIKGSWSTQENKEVVLEYPADVKEELYPGAKGKTLKRKNGSDVYYKITDDDFLKGIMICHPIITNQEKYESNMSAKKIQINTNGYGKGLVYKNCNKKDVISL